MLFWQKTPFWVKNFFSKLTWHVPEPAHARPCIYLTFDDGPIPQVTPFVLEQLQKYNAKATFFCIGNNIEKHPTVFESVVNQQHTVGNHTFNHLNGFKTANATYFQNIEKCSKVCPSHLFRPPYGKITPAQYNYILKNNNILNAECDKIKQNKIIMWDVLSYDFLSTISPQKCFEIVQKNAQSGSIVVFHDSIKAKTNIEYALPRTLQFLTAHGFEFKVLE